MLDTFRSLPAYTPTTCTSSPSRTCSPGSVVAVHSSSRTRTLPEGSSVVLRHEDLEAAAASIAPSSAAVTAKDTTRGAWRWATAAAVENLRRGAVRIQGELLALG